MNETVQSNIKDIIDKNDVVLFMKGTKVSHNVVSQMRL